MGRKKWTSEKIFGRLIRNKSRKTYWDNIHELRKRPSKEVYSIAYNLCKSPIEKEKIIGIDVLAQLGVSPRFNQRKTVQLYIEILKEAQSPKVLASILSSIGHNNEVLTQKDISYLIRFKDHSYSDVRFSLACAFLFIEDIDAIKTLIQLSNDKHPEVRDWATFGFGEQTSILNDEIIMALWNRVNDSHLNARNEAILGLALRKESKIKEVLLDELTDLESCPPVIFEAIQELNDSSFIEVLEVIYKEKSIKVEMNYKWLLDCVEILKANKE